MFASLFLTLIVAIGSSGAAPVHIDSCSFVRAGSFEHAVQIRYHNTSHVTATVVGFEIYNGPHSVNVRDHGSFASGVEIDHTLGTPTWEFLHAQPHSCVVTYVRFEDGSTWSK